MLVRQTFKYRLYPTPAQQQSLGSTLALCRELYNAALQERRDAYRMAHKSLSYYDQANQLPQCKRVRPELAEVYSQTLQDVLRRVDKAFRAFFRRVKLGQTPGYPRFRGADRFDSFCYPQSGWSLSGDRLTLSKIGSLRVRLHRPILGQVKTLTIKREAEQWYVFFSCEVEITPAVHAGPATGIDLGLLHFATLADGSVIDNPRYLRHGLQRLKAAQQKLSRCQRGSHRRSKAKRVVARQHRKVRNQRSDFLHKASRQLVQQYGVLVLEELSVGNMVKNHHLALSISDAGWGQFQEYVTYKAAWAGGHVVLVDPRGTSQRCSGCGAIVGKELAERTHSCPCGCELDRDHNAAINILRAGSAQLLLASSRSPLL